MAGMAKKKLDLQAVFAANLRKAREAARLSVPEAAERAELSMDAWYKLERGERWPSAANLAAVAAAVDSTPSELLQAE
jgi:transcriptional regulator with XRE-family HTH domain